MHQIKKNFLKKLWSGSLDNGILSSWEKMIKFPASIMAWGPMSAKDVEKIIDETANKEKYINVVKES